MLERNMLRENIIDKLYDVLDSVVNRTINKEQSFGVVLTLDDDPYASGKFALALSFLIERFPARADQWSGVWHELVKAPSENWGKYYFLQALWKLHCLGLLNTIFSDQQLQRLTEKLRWQELVDEESWKLNPPFPTNYYGVAFSIARLRFLLGWETQFASQKILQQLVEHYRTHSQHGCVDETEGKGRFDRYSILLIAEICQRHIDTGLEICDWLKDALRQVSTLILAMLNDEGVGFLWGRSIGAYGDSAFNEILTISMRLGLLDRQECAAASRFTLACSERFLNFWYDSNEQSVNLWFYRRQTDAYRAEHRLVGENISLSCQHLCVQRAWADVSFDATPLMLPDQTLKFTPFCNDKYTRGLFHWYDGKRLFVLPLINGDKHYFATSPYFPVPFSAGLITGVAQGHAPLWVPGLVDSRGCILRPLVWFGDCGYQKTKNGWEIEINYSALNVVMENGVLLSEPKKDYSCQCRTRYFIEPSTLTRVDTFSFLKHSEMYLELQCAVFPEKMRMIHSADSLHIDYESNGIQSLELNGFEDYCVERTALCSPYGALGQQITGRRDVSGAKDVTVSWQIRYC
ncbi:TPA: hypothetical protein OT818_000011 [Citrobacter koseri]|nr:hypothetical protein [Citrobacter koseri]